MTGRYVDHEPAWNFSMPGATTFTTGRYQPRLNARADYRELELRTLAWYLQAYGDLASIKHFVYAICYGASFAKAIIPVARAQGRSSLEVAAGYSMWQSGTL